MFEGKTSYNPTTDCKKYTKNQQIVMIDAIIEELCEKELSSEGRKYLNRLRDNLKHEIKMLKNITENES